MATPLPHRVCPLLSPQTHKPNHEEHLASNNSNEDSACSARAVNEFSGEEIIPFDDCETVRDARQRRVARILGAAAPQQGVDDLPLEVRRNMPLLKSSLVNFFWEKCNASVPIQRNTTTLGDLSTTILPLPLFSLTCENTSTPMF